MFTPFKCLAKPFFVILCTITVSTGCQTEDTGRCCQVLLSDASSAIPAPEFPGDGGIPRNLVGQHPAFVCESLTCVSWEGSAPFCTRKCNSGRPCLKVLSAERSSNPILVWARVSGLTTLFVSDGTVNPILLVPRP